MTLESWRTREPELKPVKPGAPIPGRLTHGAAPRVPSAWGPSSSQSPEGQEAGERERERERMCVLALGGQRPKRGAWIICDLS
jgi:hypothetical protein